MCDAVRPLSSGANIQNWNHSNDVFHWSVHTCNATVVITAATVAAAGTVMAALYVNMCACVWTDKGCMYIIVCVCLHIYICLSTYGLLCIHAICYSIYAHLNSSSHKTERILAVIMCFYSSGLFPLSLDFSHAVKVFSKFLRF